MQIRPIKWHTHIATYHIYDLSRFLSIENDILYAM